MFIGSTLKEMEEDFVRRWIPRWCRFLQIREGIPVVTLFGLLLTLVGLLLYVIDMITDVVNAITYAYNAQYWKFTFTLGLVYGAIIMQTIWKWIRDEIGRSCPIVGLKNLGSLITNWSGFQECWTLLKVERMLYKNSKTNAQLALELQDKRRDVALLKITEGICEACPQAILQLCLLLHVLEGTMTWTIGFRIASTAISLSTAGAAVVNWKKSDSLLDNKDLSLLEFIVLHAWAVPVTASRLLSVGLLLSIHPYVGAACIVVHIMLYALYLIKTVEYCRTWSGIFYAFMVGVWFFISPFSVVDTLTFRLKLLVIHFAGNTCVTVLWALNTTQLCTHPALYTTIITVNCTLFIIGIIFCTLYSRYWQ